MKRKTELLLGLLCISIFTPKLASAQVTRVEVDWEIKLLVPDSHAVAPQISLIMGNRPTLSADFAEFRINPEYDGYIGGLKIDTWRGPEELAESFYLSKPPLTEPNDRIQLTTIAEVDNDKTHYSVKRLNSQQWGSIDDSLITGCRTTGNGTINFSLNMTMSQSEIEYGHNMVSYLKIKEIRYYVDDDLARRNRTGYYLFRDGKRFVEPETDQEVIDQYIAF